MDEEDVVAVGRRCPACLASNRSEARFCDACGARLDRVAGGPPAVSGAALPTGGDRRIVTALFADIVDYSRLIGELDAEEVVDRIDEALRILADAVARYDGTIEKFIGDAVFAVFGVPRGWDDDPIRAALCAVAMSAGLETAARDRHEPALRLRIGIATGEVVTSVRSIGDSTGLAITGAAVTTAMRLQEIAEPGETLVDAATVDAARGRLSVDLIGFRQIRGNRARVAVHRLRRDDPVRSAGVRAVRLIGRDAERARIRAGLEAAIASRRGRVVVVVGEAGIGKTSLIADLGDDARRLGLAWTWTENLSYTADEYYGHARRLAQTVADEAGLDSGSFARVLMFGDDVDPDAQRRFAGAIAAIARDARFSGWESEADLVPADPAQVRRDVAAASDRYIRRLVETRGPRVIAIDDVHWMDPSSATLLDGLVRTIADIPAVLLLSARPGMAFEWASLDHVAILELRGLDRGATGRLAADVAGAILAPETVDRLHDRTGGNPLFVGETVRVLAEDGGFVVRDGRLHLAVPGPTDRVPVSLRAVLGARIDALPPRAREVLQLASVIGMVFTTADVARLAPDEAVDASLGELEAAAIVRPGSAPDEWRFCHPLLHLAAYASVLGGRRRELHGRVADRLEADQMASIGRLAHHRAAARDTVRAVPLLVEAAEVALAVGATSEALGYWRTALSLLGDDPAAASIRDRVAAAEAGSAEAGSAEASSSPIRAAS